MRLTSNCFFTTLSTVIVINNHEKGEVLLAYTVLSCTTNFLTPPNNVIIRAMLKQVAAIPSSRDEGGIHSYHCGAEFYAEGKWWPVDISEADKYSNLSSYYFGRHPANRIELSRGRDLVVEPGPVAGPINFLAHPVLEIGGKPAEIKAQFSFNRNVACKGS